MTRTMHRVQCLESSAYHYVSSGTLDTEQPMIPRVIGHPGLDLEACCRQRPVHLTTNVRWSEAETPVIGPTGDDRR